VLAGLVLVALTVTVLAAVGGPAPVGHPVRQDGLHALDTAVLRGAARLAELQDRRSGVGDRP
jgi:hypothetical protein